MVLSYITVPDRIVICLCPVRGFCRVWWFMEEKNRNASVTYSAVSVQQLWQIVILQQQWFLWYWCIGTRRRQHVWQQDQLSSTLSPSIVRDMKWCVDHPPVCDSSVSTSTTYRELPCTRLRPDEAPPGGLQRERQLLCLEDVQKFRQVRDPPESQPPSSSVYLQDKEGPFH